MTANSITELAEQIQRAPTPTDAKHATEFMAVRSFAFTSLFTELLAYDGPCTIERDLDPPDYCLTTKTEKVSIEVTSFTTGRLEIYERERQEPGLYTSTLRGEKPNTQYWRNLSTYDLLDDSSVIPHAEKDGDLDRVCYKIASEVFDGKLNGLAAYRPKFSRSVLLVHDKLSEFKSCFERRTPTLARILKSIQSQHTFDAVVLVDGNHHRGAVAVKL